jgi:hypothetical protein
MSNDLRSTALALALFGSVALLATAALPSSTTLIHPQDLGFRRLARIGQTFSKTAQPETSSIRSTWAPSQAHLLGLTLSSQHRYQSQCRTTKTQAKVPVVVVPGRWMRRRG